jgi:hypothetical protein
MKKYGEEIMYIHVFLTLALARGDWLASRSCRFTPRERGFGTHWMSNWVDHRTGLD